jgi:acetyl-CoA C-acetyltransferase
MMSGVQDVYILSAARTPVGSFNGSLKKVTAPQLGATALKAALERAQVKPEQLEEAYFGNVLQGNVGQAPARQVVIGAGCPPETEATTINKVCASGMKAIMLAAQSVALGQRKIMAAGGMESMSNSP